MKEVFLGGGQCGSPPLFFNLTSPPPPPQRWPVPVLTGGVLSRSWAGSVSQWAWGVRDNVLPPSKSHLRGSRGTEDSVFLP